MATGRWTIGLSQEGPILYLDKVAMAQFLPEGADHTVAAGHVYRAATVLNACEGMENPEHTICTLRADATYLARYRDAYTPLVVRSSESEATVRLLQAEVRAHREIARHGGSTPLHKALDDCRAAVDEAQALVPLPQGLAIDITRFKGLDALGFQRLAQAVRALFKAWLCTKTTSSEEDSTVVESAAYRALEKVMEDLESGSAPPG